MMSLLKKAITRRPFPQLPFMSENRFDSFLRDRGFNVGISGIRSFVAAGLIERLETESGDFHPFQIWPISKLFRELETRLDTGIKHFGLAPEGLKGFIDQNWPYCAKSLIDLPKSNVLLEFNQRLLPLLLWMESYFLPVVRGPRPGVVSLANADIWIWNKWAKETEIRDWLNEHSISIEALSKWRRGMLLDAGNIDPAPDLYLLLRSMPFHRRKEFKGHLRLAYDLYELAEIVRLFLERVSEQPVIKEWDPHGSPDTIWVKRNFGSQPKFGSPEFLRPVVRYYGLDPAFRVRWLVEGETEEGFILRYVERLGASIQGFVTVRNFGGDGELRKQRNSVDADLKAARQEQCFVTLTFDDSLPTRTRLKGLIACGLVNLPFVLNKPDFELENFRVDQLVAVAVAWASDLSQPIKLCQDTLVQEVASRISDKKQLGFKKVLDDILHSHGEQYKLKKGIDWGTRLADHLSEQRERETKESVYLESNLSKIERQILFVLKDSQPFIDYPLSVKNLAPDSLEILPPDLPCEP